MCASWINNLALIRFFFIFYFFRKLDKQRMYEYIINQVSRITKKYTLPLHSTSLSPFMFQPIKKNHSLYIERHKLYTIILF